ncbi:MAG: hypothetical protein RBR08_14455 [Desulforegulaceae bacterium]|nr:hypothetical protein [Desulforegulaceae bacterium]
MDTRDVLKNFIFSRIKNAFILYFEDCRDRVKADEKIFFEPLIFCYDEYDGDFFIKDSALYQEVFGKSNSIEVLSGLSVSHAFNTYSQENKDPSLWTRRDIDQLSSEKSFSGVSEFYFPNPEKAVLKNLEIVLSKTNEGERILQVSRMKDRSVIPCYP